MFIGAEFSLCEEKKKIWVFHLFQRYKEQVLHPSCVDSFKSYLLCMTIESAESSDNVQRKLHNVQRKLCDYCADAGSVQIIARDADFAFFLQDQLSPGPAQCAHLHHHHLLSFLTVRFFGGDTPCRMWFLQFDLCQIESYGWKYILIGVISVF